MEQQKDPWILAWSDAVAQIRAISPCVRLADLRGDGEYNLVVADMVKNLKVYRGTQIAWESALLDIPVAVCVFYSEASTPAVPSIAIASGSFIFIYKNARPYFKFTLPFVELPVEEV
jgi:Bardet-Biedl syndrome 1 protein